jgi:hypothetical protein
MDDLAAPPCAGAVVGPRHSGQQRSITVPSGQPQPQLDSRNRPSWGRWSVYGMQVVKHPSKPTTHRSEPRDEAFGEGDGATPG